MVNVPGVEIPHPSGGAGTPDAPDEPFATIKVSSNRSALPGLQAVDLPDEHVVEVTLDDGLVLYRRAADLLAEPETRGLPPDTLPVALTVPTGVRGGRRFLVRLYRFFKGETVTAAAVDRAAQGIEGKLVAPDALMRCLTPGDLRAPGALAEGTRALVLLHGTFSSTNGSFGSLSPASGGPAAGYWRRLGAHFAPGPETPSNIFAFEHRSLTKSPLRNALDLVEQLPRGTELSLLSHSRGGLIGEFLSRAARRSAHGAGSFFDDHDRKIIAALYAGDAQAETLAQTLEDLDELDTKFAEKQLRMGPFVRVACPMRGTILASKRLDLYLSVFLNLLSLVPGPQQVFVKPFGAFARAIVGSRTDPRILPGIEAMMPDAPTVALLNRQNLTLDAPLDVIGGDIEPGGVLRALTVFAADLFFREDHDLVVNTAAMFGGAPRATEPRALARRGSTVSHFSYFQDRESLDRMTGALTGTLKPPAPAIVETLDDAVRGSRDDSTKPMALLLPGIMGSTLSKGDDKIWVDPVDLVLGGIRKIGADAQGVPAADVRPTGVVERYYMKLAGYLSRSHEMRVLDYDWRLSIDAAADRLNSVVSQLLDRSSDTRRPMRLVCHSMGGLVARRMIVKHRATWKRMHENRPGSRIVMLGTPNGGSASMAAGLIGHDRMIRQLALVDITSDMREILEALTPLPGILELLPTDDGFAYFDAATWQGLSGAAPKGWEPPPQDALDRARAVWAGMDLRPEDIPHIRYVAGQAPSTVTAIRPEPFAVLATPNGDGRVTWATGVLPGVQTWFAAGVGHGDLARDRRLFEPIAELLLHGSTEKLPRTPPVTRDAETVFELREEPVIYPAGGEFELLPMGGTPDPELVERAEPPTARVLIEHGDLRLQPGAIMVGHYRGAALLSAENVLDTLLDGALDMHRDAGLYPGEIGTSELFSRGSAPTLGPDAALVLGLGPFGELSPQDLRTTMTQALVRFALKSPADPDRRRGLTSLIIGHLDSRITVEESVAALLEALDAANRKVPERLRIEELKILELYEDRAIQAAEALESLAAKERFEGLTIEPRLREGGAGRKRLSYGRDNEWQMIVEVTCPDAAPDTLRFQVMNRSALVETNAIGIDRRALDHMIREVRTDLQFTPDVGRLLFRRLVPRSVRHVLSEGSNVTLVLDRVAARYPWELAQDRADDEPISVRTKMIRQLIQTLQPDRPRRPATNTALVIGDPVSFYAPLPHALAEAEMVYDKLRTARVADVVKGFGKDPEIETKLFLTEPRILHFAGHGVLGKDDDPDRRRRQDALVIGQDSFLSAADIEQMDSVPEFVFLNCCHVGLIDGAAMPETDRGAADPRDPVADRTGLAANIAVAYMRQGAKAVIAAGWAIQDAQAKLFSRTFYDQFLAGYTFADAIKAAREATFKGAGGDATWGAYQCYGDPQYRLRTLGGTAPAREEDESYSARAQVLAALQVIRADARFVRDQADAQRLFEKIGKIEVAVLAQGTWSRDPSVLEALGLGLAEIGERDRAIRYLSQAAQASPPTVTIGSMELLDSLRVRKATDLRLAAEGTAEEDRRIAAELDEHVDAIAALSHHTEHYARDLPSEGGAEPPGASQAMITRLLRQGDTQLRYAAALAARRGRKDYRAALGAARDAYSAAEEQIGSAHAVELAYARLRGAAARFFLASDTATSGIDLIHVVDAVISSLEAVPGARPVFQRELRLAEAQLLMLLVEGVFGPSEHEEMVNAFMEAFFSGATVGQRQETISDLHALSRLIGRQKSNAAMAQSVATIASELRRMALL